MESAGETCTINEECTSFFCTGVVDPDNNPPAVADSTYTFLPCEDPIAIHILSTVSSLPGMVIDAQLNDSAVIVLNPEFLGTVELTFEQTEDGVRFGVSDEDNWKAHTHNIIHAQYRLILRREQASYNLGGGVVV